MTRPGVRPQGGVRLWHICLPLLVLANLAYLTHNVFGWVVTLAFFLYAPGYLLVNRITRSKSFGAGKFSLSVGLSLALITMTGLALNSLHFLGVERPMETLPIFIALDVVTLGLIGLNWSARIRPRITLPHLKKEEIMFVSLFALLPLLSIFGAIRLNNGASNILTMIMIPTIGALYLALILRPAMGRIYPYAIFMTALAILFSISLRGWSITGHDIHHEYNVFTAVINTGYWSPSRWGGDPYNACLSITILPAILAKITGIHLIFIYKIVFQVVFAAIVPALYFFCKRFAIEKKALLGVFAFMTFPTFVNDLPFLNRQEVALGYFILLLLVNFSNITYRAKSAFTVILLLGLILSHYSTSYVTISLLLLTLIIYRVLLPLYKNTPKLNIPLLSLPIIIMAFLATFVWNMQITSSSSNLSSTLTAAAKSVFGEKESSSFSRYGLLSNARTVTPEEQLEKRAKKLDISLAYTPSYVAPLTGFGKVVSKVVDVYKLNAGLYAIIAKILQLLVMVGVVILALRFRKKQAKPRDIYLLALSFSFIIALVLFTLLPQLSVGYDVTRLFQQSMTVLWLPIILACLWIFGWLGKYALAATTGLLVFLYMTLVGFIPQLTGGYLPKLSLNNSGVYYDYFYTHRSDIDGSRWLAANRITYMNVFMDINSASPPLGFPVALGLLDGESQGYYYTDYTNNTADQYRTIINGAFIQYTNPAFTANKSLIYSSNETKIYFKWPNSLPSR
ncbi:DUF2206 domain-containing protein [Candidatus Saccharibacteria bacterium]|nr:MAG: DUF2206 domain-containing protein [Candidatus Saccharibacteria bacterium]